MLKEELVTIAEGKPASKSRRTKGEGEWRQERRFWVFNIQKR
jgi:hypothetical protein